MGKNISEVTMHRFDVCFQIVSEEVSPDRVTKLLNISPDEYFEPGATTGMSDGKSVERDAGGPGIWSIKDPSVETSTLEQIELLLTVIRPLSNELCELKRAGAQMRFFVGFFSNDTLGWMLLPCKLMEEIGSLGIDVDVSFYGSCGNS